MVTEIIGLAVIMFTLIVAAVYIGPGVHHVFPLNWRKKWHVQQKIEITQKKQWDLEFLKEKMKAMKEGFRMQYDRLKEELDAATLRTNVEKEKGESADKQIIANLANMITHHEKDIGQLKTQMDAVDSQIEGQMNEETGQLVGVDPQIDGFRTVVGMLKEYKKKL